jgi:DNA-binding transcriptional regulator YiaG
MSTKKTGSGKKGAARAGANSGKDSGGDTEKKEQGIENVRELRIALGMTQLEFATLLGVSATSVEYWERVGVPRIGMSKDVLMIMIDSMNKKGEVWIGDVCLRRVNEVTIDRRGYVRHTPLTRKTRDDRKQRK